jgi:choline dehydrogenase-like flavoprotein
MRYDYLIVGAGSAGCILANRLSEDPATNVLLLEAGEGDSNPLVHMPKGIAKMIANPNATWPFVTTPCPSVGIGAEPWARGKLLGGSSSINGMVYVRGQAADFDALAEAAGGDWAWEKIGPAYRAMESHELGAAASRGDRGPLKITMASGQSRFAKLAIAAGKGLGWAAVDDPNAPDGQERIGPMARTIYNGRRQSAAVAFLHPVRGRPNLTVHTGVLVDKVEFEGRRAVAVLGRQAGLPRRYEAAREILLCAGALSSPAILQRSGVGPAGLLQRLGIPIVQANEEVGRNLREHRALVMQWRIKDEYSLNRKYRGLGLLRSVAEYYVTRQGPMSSAAYDLGAWLKSGPGQGRPDIQILLSPFSFDPENPMGVEKQGGMNMCVYMLRPSSSGALTIVSPNPEALPTIAANFLSTEGDVQTSIAAIRSARRLAAQSPLADIVVAETRPGPECQTDQAILDAIWRLGQTGYHAVGSCRVGRDDGAVVDGELRVVGVQGLRVVDASIFPAIPSGNTNGPVMVAAWRAADLILGAARASSRPATGARQNARTRSAPRV